MANLFDYLQWRGDLTLAQSPFNEVDNLILCELSYIELGGIVPAPTQPGCLLLKEAAARYFKGRDATEFHMGVLVPDTIPQLFAQMANYPRFQNLRLCGYVNQIDESQQKQFSALCILLDDGTRFVAYRGTDDTIVGWKENFNMSFLSSVPAQLDALAYLTSIAAGCNEPLRIGGHSKGGNLAVYAAMHAPSEVQARILEVYNNDGPGFRENIVQQAGYQAIRERVHTIIPQSSVVGLLLEHEEAYQVVKSSQTGLFQHDGFSWEVCGPCFLHLDDLSGSSRHLDQALKAWLNDMDQAQRRQFVDALSTLLDATQAKTLTDLSSSKLKTAAALVNTWKHLDENTREMLTNTFHGLLHESLQLAQLKIRSGE